MQETLRELRLRFKPVVIEGIKDVIIYYSLRLLLIFTLRVSSVSFSISPENSSVESRRQEQFISLRGTPAEIS